MDSRIKKVEKFEIICVQGEPSQDLYYLHDGQLMAFFVLGKEIKPIGLINPGEFLGELSFFDSRPRSSFAIAMDVCTLVSLPQKSYLQKFPHWLKVLGIK